MNLCTDTTWCSLLSKASLPRARAGHLKRDPNSDTAMPDPKLPNPTCLVNITWVVARSNPDRSEDKQSAEARPR